MKYLILTSLLVLSFSFCIAQVMHQGAMSEMGNNGFAPRIALDSLQRYDALVALGPFGKMQGEVTAVDGKVYVSSVKSDQVTTSYKLQGGSPFLVYANVSKWEKVNLDGTVNSLQELEAVIKQTAQAQGIDLGLPFFFKVEGVFDQMSTHILTPRSPEINGYVQGQDRKVFEHENEFGQLIGVFSREGRRIYTHHDSDIHVHFLSKNGNYTGHLDQFSSELSRAVIYFPSEILR
ncbi:acetolactate decarboxylase [Algoriphagus sp.]|uniref:acetolactate decarboxylase n=1 Tax=Algoriphagus sp. TaxID=1872435 RepID=UPI0026076F16|nr:acetolactate decarboxylase [Algoriphagus sp.]